MPTIRLYRAVREQRDAQAVHDAAVFNGNYGPPKSLPHGSALIIRLSQANQELHKAMEEAKAIVEAVDDLTRANAVRISGERDIARFVINNLIQNGYELRGWDGESGTTWTTNAPAILDYVMNLDVAHIYVRHKEMWGDNGFVFLVFGNSPQELIADYDLAIETALTPTFKYIKSFYDNTYILPEEL